MFSAIRQALGLGRKELPGLLATPYEVPEVSARDHSNREVHLKEAMNSGAWVLFFYPKAETPGCTAQACSLRDAFEGLSEKGVQVMGVSGDSVAAQQSFVRRQRLPFALLADPDGEVRKAFGVGSMPLLGWSQREVFVIKNGSVVWHDASASTHQQAEDVLKILEQL